jgi:hypothetical protein
LFARVFWSLNVSAAGVLIGKSLYSVQHDAGEPLPLVLLGYGISHGIVSVICYKKFVGKGLLSKH